MIIAVGAAICALCIFIISKINFGREYRFKQVPQLAIALVYVIAITAAFPLLLEVVDPVISRDYITGAVLEGVPAESYSAAFMLLIAVVSNAIILLLSLPFIFIGNRLSKRSFEYASWFFSVRAENFADRFYDITGSDTVTLRDKNIVTGRWINAMRIAVLILGFAGLIAAFVLLYVPMGISDKMLIRLVKFAFILPSASYIFLAELFYFLDGCAADEDQLNFESDVIDSFRTGDYSPLLDVYKRRFGEALVNPENCIVEKSAVDEFVFNDPGQDTISRCKDPQAFRTVIESIKHSCSHMAESYVDATVAMMNNDSIIVNDSFFGEFAPFLAGYLNYIIATGKKAIVVDLDGVDAPFMIRELNRRFRDINELDPVWVVEKASENRNPYADVLILDSMDPEELQDSSFLDNAGCIIINDSSGLITSGAASDLFSKLRLFESITGQDLQYIFFCQEDSRNLEESIEHIINKQLTLYKNSIIENDSYVLVWKDESASKIQYQLREEGSYMGTAYPVILVAATAGVWNIGFRASKRVPFTTYKDVVLASINELKQNVFKESSVNINNLVSLNDLSSFTEESPLRFLVVTDENNNLLTVARNWCKYSGTESTMIHIISRPYLLRNYMAENLPMLVTTSSVIRQIVPGKGEDTHRNAANVLMSLYEERKGLVDTELVDSYNRHNGRSFRPDQVEECIREMLKKACPEYASADIYSLFAFNREEVFEMTKSSGDFRDRYRIKMSSAPLYKRLLSLSGYARYRYGGSDISKRLDINVEDIVNYFMPDQIHCFDGELAKIKEICKGEIILEKVSPKDFPQYELIGSYECKLKKEKRLIFGLDGKYKVIELAGTISGNMQGYYELNAGKTFANETAFSRVLLEAENNPSLIMSRRQSSGMQVVIDRKLAGSNPTGLRIMMVNMINELFKTLFPNNYRDISAFISWTPELETLKNSLTGADSHIFAMTPVLKFDGELPEDDDTSIYIFEKSTLSKGLVSECKERENLQNMFDILYKYLQWETSDRVNGERFLQYGMGAYPSMFDTEGTMNFLAGICTSGMPEDITAVSPDDIMLPDDASGSLRCDYCGRLATERLKVTDDRIICNKCAAQIVTRQSELWDLYTLARKMIQDRYGIKLPSRLSVKFKSRTEIRREAAKLGLGAEGTIGIYVGSKKSIWVERQAPKMFILNVLMHELVHAWQAEKYGRSLSLVVSEGHATFVSLELLREMKEEMYVNLWIRMIKGLTTDTYYYEGYNLFDLKCRKEGRRRNPFDVVEELAHGRTENREIE